MQGGDRGIFFTFVVTDAIVSGGLVVVEEEQNSAPGELVEPIDGRRGVVTCGIGTVRGARENSTSIRSESPPERAQLALWGV